MKYLLTLFLFCFCVLEADEKVVLQLKWHHQFQFAGYYAAKEKGFYQQYGLDVEIRERDLSKDNITQVLEGEADYGVTDSVLFLYQARKLPLQMVTPIFQHSPNVLISLKQSAISSPYQLDNKKLRFYKHDSDGFGIMAMLRSIQVEPLLTRVRSRNDINFLIQEEFDAMASYAANEPFILQQKNLEYNIIDPAHYGFDLYGDMLFTSTHETLQNPQRVINFKKATLQGWQYALQHPQEIIELIHTKYATQKSLEHLRFEAKVLTQYIQADSIPLGTLDSGRIKFTLDLYKKYKLIEDYGTVDEYIFQPYKTELALTTQERYYLANKGKLTLCIDPKWMPLESNYKGKHIGMSADYFELLEQKLKIPIEMLDTKTWLESIERGKNRECDLFSLVMPTKERLEYLDFTSNYLSIPLVISTKLDAFFIENFKSLVGKKVGITKGYAYAEILAERYPELTLIPVDNIIDGLEMVKTGQLFGFIDTLATTGYEIQKNYIGELKIAGKFDEKWELGIGTRNDEPVLRTIFNKAIATIPPQTHQNILNKWVSVNYDSKDNRYKKPLLIALAITSFLIAVLILILRINSKLQKEIQSKELAQKELQKQLKIIEVLSITDALTGLYNRRYFNEILPREYNRAKREKQPFAFLMFDVDFFKNYNDNYGHQKGDLALSQIGQVLQNYSKRGSDFAFRLGGEEFGVIFTEKSFKSAYAYAQKIREEVEELHIQHATSSVADFLTVSVGIVFYHSLENISEDAIYKQVDENLYEAKAQGRNIVIGTEVK